MAGAPPGVRVRTPDGPTEVLLRSFPGNTVGDLRAYLQRKYKNCVIRLVGQRVTPFEQYDLLGPLLKRAKVKGAAVLFVADDNSKGWDVTAFENYNMVAITERETPLLDTALLRPYIKGQARYRFEALAQKDLKANEFEIYIMLYGKERLQLIVSQDWTIRRIKAEIQSSLGIPTYNQRLFSKASAGDLLPDYKTVMDCGFGPKSCLDLNLVTGTPRGTPRKRDPSTLLVITRPVDIRVRVPPRGRIVSLPCDHNDTVSAVKTRLARQIDPARSVSLVPLDPGPWGHGLGDDSSSEPEDDEAYLQHFMQHLSLKELSPDSLPELEEFDGDADDLGLSAQELLAALKASQEQVRLLQQELQVCKERQQTRAHRSRRNSRSSIKSQ